MSFSTEVKEELSKLSNLANKACVKAELFGYLNTNNSSVGDFSYLNNNFIEYYAQCNKTSFATDLARNINTVTSINNNSTNEQRAVYYFKEIFGI